MSENTQIGFIAQNICRTMPYTLYQFGILSSLVTQEWTGVYFSAGLFLFGDVLNGGILKPLFKKLGPNVESFKRPSSNDCGIYANCSNVTKKQTWGMPSGHSQMMAIFAVFWICYLLQYVLTDQNEVSCYISIAIILLLALIVMYSRILVKCHNLLQVTTGALLGTGLGYLLYYIYTLIFPKSVVV